MKVVKIETPTNRHNVISCIDFGYVLRENKTHMVVKTCVNALKKDWREIKVDKRISKIVEIPSGKI